MAKLTKLQPVLVERTCEYCEDGLLTLKEQHNDGNHLFRETKWWYEYECKNCGRIITSDKALRLREIIYVDPETGEQYRTFTGGNIFIDA